MNTLSLVYCEMRKAFKSSVFWVVAVAFTVFPWISLIKFSSAANISWAFYLSETLDSFFGILIVGFSFTTCWVFGREYTDKTINDLLVKPISKLRIACSKFTVILMWNILLTVLMFTVVVLVGVYIGLTGSATTLILHYFLVFAAMALLTMFVSMISSFVANVTKGYLAPIGLTFLIVLAVNIVENVGLTHYFPWTIPRLIISDGYLSTISILILTITGVVGFVGTVAWWRYVDQK